MSYNMFLAKWPLIKLLALAYIDLSEWPGCFLSLHQPLILMNIYRQRKRTGEEGEGGVLLYAR